jgi:hypothetical protein
MIIILNLHSGTKLSGWLRHCCRLLAYLKICMQKSTQKNLPGKTDFIIVNAAYTTSHSSCKCNVIRVTCATRFKYDKMFLKPFNLPTINTELFYQTTFTTVITMHYKHCFNNTIYFFKKLCGTLCGSLKRTNPFGIHVE